MAVLVDAYGNCTTDFQGSGLGNCDVTNYGDVKGLILFKKGWSKDITDGSVDFDLTSYKNDVKALNIFPYVRGFYDFTQDTPENEQSTSSNGTKSVVRLGKPEFGFMYETGRCGNQSLFNKRGQLIWDFGILFEQGILIASNSTFTKIKAFDGGMLDVNTMRFIQGTDREGTTVKIQVLDAIEFNERQKWFPFDKVGDLDEVIGAIETSITVDAIADTATTFTFSVVSACNKDSVILDLDDETKYVLLGTQASATTISGVAYNASTGKYTATVTPALASSDTVQIKLSDGTYDVIEDTAGNLYKGTSNSVTVS